MNLDSDVNVRAARNLVATVKETLHVEEQAITYLESCVARDERALRRAIRMQKVAPTIAAILIATAVGVVAVAGVVHGALHLGIDSVLWGTLAIVGIPGIGSMFVADRAGTRVTHLIEDRDSLRTRLADLRYGIGAMSITVAESEDVLRRVTAAAA